jgi:hypothetical protein
MAEAIAAAEARSFAAMVQAGADPRAKGSKYSGHFAGLSLIRKDAQKEPQRRSRPVDQQALEAMLADRARCLGIDLRRECEVRSFVQQADGVDVEWTSPRSADDIRCTYLVGCDGGRSLIRKTAGFDFPGTDPSSTFYQAVAQIDHPERLAPMGWRRTSGGVFSYGPFPGRLVMLEFSGPEHRQAPVTREEIEDVLRRVSGADVRVKALESGSRWTDNTRLVDTYRKGRVLLAGGCGAYSYAVRRSGPDSWARRCGETRLEACRGYSRRNARKPSRHLHGRAATRRGSCSGKQPCPGRHHAARSTVGRDAGPRGEPLGLRRCKPPHRRDDERSFHPLQSRVGAGRGRTANQRPADQPRRRRRLALRCHAGWKGRSSGRLNPREAFRTRCSHDPEDPLRRRRHRAFDADPSRCLHCLGR